MDGKMRLLTALYIERDGQVLLLYRVGSRVVSPSWCGIGGHVEPDEIGDAQACVLRELEEETCIRREMLEGIRLRYITLRLKKGEILHNYYFFATLRDDVEVEMACNEGSLAWTDEAQVLELDMPYTAKAVLTHYYAGERDDERVYGGIATPSGVSFTPLEEF